MRSRCRGRDRAHHHAVEPARHSRVGHRVRDPDVRLHRRRHRVDRASASASWPPVTTCSAESAALHVIQHATDLHRLSLWCSCSLRSFASGCTALTGVEAISNGVPAFREPKSDNAATTLALLGGIAVSMFLAITALGDRHSHVHIARHGRSRQSGWRAAGLHTSKTVIAQIGATVFGGDRSLGFYYLQAVTALILVLAANTAFNGFPVLASILARDGYLPRQLHTRGDRLAFSNGILLLAGFAIAADLRLLSVADPADPALHRRCVRVVREQPDRHDPALESQPAADDGSGTTTADAAVARHQQRSAPS